jgi:hypothetical protein
MTDADYRFRLERAASWAAEGQQTPESEPFAILHKSGAILHKSGARSPQTRINRAIARQSSSIVASLEQACHAGGLRVRVPSLPLEAL